MDSSEHDERRRRLQRVAYGADASPEERAAAEAELQRLADAAASAVPGVEAAPAGTDASVDGAPVGDEPVEATEEDTDSTARPARSTVRWAVGAGSVALVAGLVAGANLGPLVSALAPEEPVSPGIIHADGAIVPGGTVSVDPGTGSIAAGAAQGTPVELTPAYKVFEREPQASDMLGIEIVTGMELEPASPRLLVTRSDGAALFAATKDDGAELCIVVTLNDSGAGATCTDDGLLPPDGLLLNVGMEAMPPVTAFLRVDGTAGLSFAEQPAAE